MNPAAYLSSPLPVLLAGRETQAEGMVSLLPVGCMLLLLERYRHGNGRISASLYLCIQALFLLGEWLGPEQIQTAALLSMAAIILAYGSWNDRICAHDLCNLVAITAIFWFVACNHNTSVIWQAALLHLVMAALDILFEDQFLHTGTEAIVSRKQMALHKHTDCGAEIGRRPLNLIFLRGPVPGPIKAPHPEATW